MFYVDGLNVIDSRSLEQYYAFSQAQSEMQARGVMGNVVSNDGKCSCYNNFNNEHAIIGNYQLHQEQ